MSVAVSMLNYFNARALHNKERLRGQCLILHPIIRSRDFFLIVFVSFLALPFRLVSAV